MNDERIHYLPLTDGAIIDRLQRAYLALCGPRISPSDKRAAMEWILQATNAIRFRHAGEEEIR